MVSNYLLFGSIMGILFGIPAGAIGVLSIQRGLKSGPLACFITGMGSSTVDVIYVAIGVYGASFISDWLFQYQMIISVIGSLLIITMGILIFTSREQSSIKEKDEKVNYGLFYLSSLFISLTNPATILSFLAILSMFGIGNVSEIEGIQLIIGIFVGTGIWWITLSILVNVIKNKIVNQVFKIMNCILGAIMVLIGIIMILRLFWS